MVSVKITIPQEVEDLLDGLSDDEIKEILLDSADGFCGPGGVLEKHWQHGQSSWGDPDDKYMDRKKRVYGNQEKFVKTGAAKDALTRKSPYRVIKASKGRDGHKVEVALVRMVNGRNVYSIAQAGGRNNSGPPMRITQALPGDTEIVQPYVEASIVRAFRKKGIM